ncbi:flagellar hook-associated protein FlgK [Yoonia vestfoldensis]|uniref:Flagellar hook-associated protein 1 n=1 Tax=Yoonia vestfoldensis SKA53 TaxID=314232 RepID=A3V259_9RHOB|nr:flagellar hook-associated protein FlgK [Yoonia vestfoldensis]EAQ07440.1 FlgK flagellar hook-associated protein 1 [Yoonia vestfoldensis SKA53]
MASLLDIGRSAVQAQREALNVTGQNIVNANTEGYRRRDATLTEVYGIQSELTGLSSQTGLGVKLGEIRRAYDGFLTESKRSATARFEASDAFVGKLEQLENLILPNDGDLGVVMTAFFDNLTQVAASPGDPAPREAALEMGETVANAFNTTAGMLTSLMNGTAEEIGVELVDVNRTLQSLGIINGQLRSSNIGSAPPHNLLDERDRLLDSLAEKIPVNIKIGERLDAELRLGASDSGPLILTGEDAKKLSVVEGESGSIMFRVGSGQIVSQLETGGLRGLVDAHGTNRRALSELDALARDFSQKLNDQHAQGIDLDGQLGRELFAVVDFSVTAGASNQGDAQATIRLVPGLADRLGALQMTFDGRRGQWQLTDDTGARLGAGRASLEIDGAVILVEGTPKDGDTFSITPMSGEASRISFLLTRGEEIAAASTIAIYPTTTNKGSAVLTSTQEALPGSGVPALSSVLTNNLSPVAAKDFLRGGVVGSIPRGTESITLASLATQTTATVSAQNDADIGGLILTLRDRDSGSVIEYSFSPDSDTDPSGAWASGEEFAKYLSAGVLRGVSSENSAKVTISELGLSVTGSATGFTFASDGARELEAISAVSAGGNALLTGITSGKPASDIRIFTREGRQVSGTPLAAAEVAQLLTTENGFNASAEYRSDYNAVSGSSSYRGMSVVQRSSGADPLASGLQSKMVSLTGLSGPAGGTISSNPAANSTTAQTITLEMYTGTTGTLSIPAGVDAAYVAQEANKAFAPVGVSAVARTAIRLSLDGVGSGTTQFDLKGVNDTALKITAQINDGDLSELVQAVNRRSDETGVTAELSVSGNAVTLVQRDGFDVVTTNISSGVALRASSLDQMYNPLASEDFTADLRFSGTIAFTSGSGFALKTSGGKPLVSVADPMKGGLASQEHSNGGTLAALSYAVDSRIDGLSQNVDGTRIHAPSARFETVLTAAYGTLLMEFTADVSANELSAGIMTGESVAQLTAQKLRAQAPIPSLEGDALISTSNPPIGASARFVLAGAEYTLTRVDNRLTALDFEMTGPEAGRILPRVIKTNEGFSLSLIVADGQLAGAGPRPVTDSGAEAFGLSDTQLTQSLQGRSFDATDGTYQINVTVGGVAKTVILQAKDGKLTQSDPKPDELSVDITGGDDEPTSITLTSALGLAVTPSVDAAALGFKLANAELSVENGRLLARSTDETVVDIKARGTSAAGIYLHLDDLPDEELIVVMGSDGARRLSAEFKIGEPLTAKTRGPEQFRIEMMDDASGRVELFDMVSGASIATRMSSGLARFNVTGQTLELAGFADTGDSFQFATGQRSSGDSRNLDELIKLGEQGSGRRTFQDNFRSIAAGVGSSLEAGRLTRASNEAVRDAAVASESELSGVNLDEEAAKLMAQQQAYQAAARILQTARELFDTLIRIA